MASTVLVGIVVLLVGAAIAVQVYYVLGLKRAGVEISKAVIVVSVANIAMLVVVALGLIAYVLGVLTQRM